MYEARHSGVVFVCGSASTLFDDYEKAESIWPDHECIAVKGASAYIKAFALFGLHHGKLDRMRGQQLKIHSDFSVHTGGEIEFTKFGKPKIGHYDYWWPDCDSNSGWQAVKIAHLMGFDLVVMCGIPLVKCGYVDGFSKQFQNDKIVDLYRHQVERDIMFHQNTLSMSGWTRDFFSDNHLSDKRA